VGGAELQLSLLAREFEKRGCEVHLIVDDFGQADVTQHGTIKLHKVALKYMGGSNWYLIPAWLNLLRTLTRINADIHILKLPRSVMPPLGLYCWLRRKKLVFVGQIDNDIDLKFLRSADGLIPYWFYRFGMHFVTTTVAQNRLQADGFDTVFRKPTTIIQNAVAEPDSIPDIEKDMVLWVGRNLPKKHPELFADLARRLPQHRFVMIMAPNPGQEDWMYRELESEVDNFEYKGFLPFHETQDYFFRARVFACTSDREGFPNVFLQAWQAKCPVVSLTIDPDGVIEKYALGRVSKDLMTMSEDIDLLMTDDALRDKVVSNGITYIRENHAIKSVADKYEALFHKLDQTK
jgi:glycosyltransferase involved in cell wall biosynthesis